MSRLSFVESHPEAARFWDYDLNEGLVPEDFTYGSNQKAWWTSEVCGHSWLREIKKQTRNVRCLVCAPAVGAAKSLATKQRQRGLLTEKAPQLVEEWSSSNELGPEGFTVVSYVPALWRCKDCSHEWSAIIRERARGRGACPHCRGLVAIPGVSDFVTRYPELAASLASPEEKAKASQLTEKSGVKLLWSCKKCSHSWSAPVRARVKGRDCPECYRSSKVSRGQRELFTFLEQEGHELLMNARIFPGSAAEVDVYLPRLGVAIEYNGDYWHSDAVTLKRWGVSARERHEEKLYWAAERGVRLLFLWDSDWSSSKVELQEALREFFSTGKLDPRLLKVTSSLAVTPPALNASTPLEEPFARPMSASKRELFIARYLAGESPNNFYEELKVSKDECFTLIKELNLVAERAKLGLGPRGERIVPPEREVEFRKDAKLLTQQELQVKYSLSYKTLKRLLSLKRGS